MDEHQSEVRAGERFEFGRNWQRFLERLTEERIEAAIASLRRMLDVQDLEGRSFVDVGSGSGLFSLAARRLGARVTSFDFDPQSVACTEELRRRFFPGDDDWSVQRGSALDESFLSSLGTFDIVYSWGVLHHTGRMWDALAGVDRLVAPRGLLAIAIYNDQGAPSRRWTWIKKTYNRSSKPVRALLLAGAATYFKSRSAIGRLARLQNPFRTESKGDLVERGMAFWPDLVDWVGGYPFEVAKPEEIFEFYRDRGYVLVGLRTCAGGLGCNEFVFRRSGTPGG